MRYGLRTLGFCAIGVASVIACGSSGNDSGDGSGDGPRRLDGAAGETESGATGVTDDASSLDAATGPGAPGDAETGTSDPGPHDAGHGDAGAMRCKRGIATNTPPSAALAPTASSAGVSWWYDWSLAGTGGSSAVEFVPMVWGSANAASVLPQGARYVLGFNEPNFKGQANLSPQQAAAAWPMIEAHAKAIGAGVQIISPAVNYCGSASDSSQCTVATITDPYTYLKDFFAACAGCQVDYVAVHWYNCDLPSLKAYLEGNLDAGGGLQGFVQFGKPIWLTEFSCDGSHSVADQTAYMKAAVPYLEANPHVFRYSWFSAGPIPNAELMNANGSLTALGSTYVALPENCQ
jgi:hypothetical protein